jgi:O-methyltransferase
VADDLDGLRRWLLSEHLATVCADRLDVVARELAGLISARVPGAVVELGCYRGAMALWMRAILDTLGAGHREVHVYDSFAGLPSPGELDSPHVRTGELAASVADVVATHARWGKRAPVIHSGWFDDSLLGELPPGIAFCYVDPDLFQSTLTCLQHSVPRLSAGGSLIVDDYADIAVNPRAWNGLPGVKRACDEFFGDPSPMEVIIGVSDLAFGRYRPAR